MNFAGLGNSILCSLDLMTSMTSLSFMEATSARAVSDRRAVGINCDFMADSEEGIGNLGHYTGRIFAAYDREAAWAEDDGLYRNYDGRGNRRDRWWVRSFLRAFFVGVGWWCKREVPGSHFQIRVWAGGSVWVLRLRWG